MDIYQLIRAVPGTVFEKTACFLVSGGGGGLSIAGRAKVVEN